MKERKTTFETADLLLAAFLLARNRKLVAIRPGAPGSVYCIFVFADPEQNIDAPNGLHQEFLSDGSAPVRTLARHFGRLRACIRQLRDDSSAGEYLSLDELFPLGRVGRVKLLRSLRRAAHRETR